MNSKEIFSQVICEVSTMYGAPMGRPDIGTRPTDSSIKIRDRRVPMCSCCGAYDKGGAYWGIDKELRVQYTDDLSYVHFYRYNDDNYDHIYATYMVYVTDDGLRYMFARRPSIKKFEGLPSHVELPGGVAFMMDEYSPVTGKIPDVERAFIEMQRIGGGDVKCHRHEKWEHKGKLIAAYIEYQ